MMNQSNFKKLISYLGLLSISFSFVGLGIWQWNRAQESRKPFFVSELVVPLDSVTQPRVALPSKATLRRVEVAGHYIGSLQAPHQVDGLGKEAIWDVGLLQTDPGAVILVVRGLWSERVTTSEKSRVNLMGKLLPHQSDDYVQSSPGVLRRLDSSLIVGQTKEDIYDGYLVAESEKIDGVSSARSHIAPPTPRSAVPGFYWQHLSYVLIWWFMAGLVLYLPFYQRRVAPEKVELVSARNEEAHG